MNNYSSLFSFRGLSKCITCCFYLRITNVSPNKIVKKSGKGNKYVQRVDTLWHKKQCTSVDNRFKCVNIEPFLLSKQWNLVETRTLVQITKHICFSGKEKQTRLSIVRYTSPGRSNKGFNCWDKGLEKGWFEMWGLSIYQRIVCIVHGIKTTTIEGISGWNKTNVVIVINRRCWLFYSTLRCRV